jgi:hypothetical protein
MGLFSVERENQLKRLWDLFRGVDNSITSGDINALMPTSLATVTSDHTAAQTITLASGTLTVSLPSVNGLSGRKYTIKNTGSGVITVDGSGSETIDNVSTQELIEMETITIVSDGAEWWII